MIRWQRRAHVWIWTLVALFVIAAGAAAINARQRTDAALTAPQANPWERP